MCVCVTVFLSDLSLCKRKLGFSPWLVIFLYLLWGEGRGKGDTSVHFLLMRSMFLFLLLLLTEDEKYMVYFYFLFFWDRCEVNSSEVLLFFLVWFV